MGRLFLTLLILATAEIYLLMELGGRLGAPVTIGLVLATAFLGSFLVKRQGMATLARLQQRTASGEAPHAEMLEGAGLIIAGAFLVTPGFVTDACGFLMLVPQFRRHLIHSILEQLKLKAQHQAQQQQAFFEQMRQQAGQQGQYRQDGYGQADGDLIDADVVEVDAEDSRANHSKPLPHNNQND